MRGNTVVLEEHVNQSVTVQPLSCDLSSTTTLLLIWYRHYGKEERKEEWMS